VNAFRGHVARQCCWRSPSGCARAGGGGGKSPSWTEAKLRDAGKQGSRAWSDTTNGVKRGVGDATRDTKREAGNAYRGASRGASDAYSGASAAGTRAVNSGAASVQRASNFVSSVSSNTGVTSTLNSVGVKNPFGG